MIGAAIDIAAQVMRQQQEKASRVKPLLRRSFNVNIPGYEWMCSDRSECYAIGWGATREAAYEQWLARFARCRRDRRV